MTFTTFDGFHDFASFTVSDDFDNLTSLRLRLLHFDLQSILKCECPFLPLKIEKGLLYNNIN